MLHEHFFLLETYKILRNKIYLSMIHYVPCCVRLSCLIFVMLFSFEFPGSQISPVTYCTNVQLWRLYFLSVIIDFYIHMYYKYIQFIHVNTYKHFPESRMKYVPTFCYNFIRLQLKLKSILNIIWLIYKCSTPSEQYLNYISSII